MYIEFVIFDPYYWILSLGISLNRYVEADNDYMWVRKELDIGLLLFSLRINFIFNKRKREE
jgi:hypothetical protein